MEVTRGYADNRLSLETLDLHRRVDQICCSEAESELVLRVLSRAKDLPAH